MAQERHLLCKGALFFFDIKVVVLQCSEHFPQVSHMFLQGLAIDDYVIKRNNYKTIEERSKYFFHKSAKCGRCICEDKRHDNELIRTIMGHTCRLWLISFGCANLIVPIQIEFGKVPCISKLIKQVINARDEILVFDGDLVECPIVDA